jgi:hypothetical protein
MGGSYKMARPLIYDRGFSNNIIGDVDQKIKNTILSMLSDEHVFINTTWIEKDLELKNIINKNKIAVCYSGPDWENSNCIDIRKDAHLFIKNNSKKTIHIGNTEGLYYFNFWAEFIRMNFDSFFDTKYTVLPNFKKVYMCLNRKPHAHRLFLINELIEKNLTDKGLISLGDSEKLMIIDEQLDDIVLLGENAVHGKMPIKNDILTLGDAKNWNSFFINVVTETTIHTDLFISEKTWKPIIGLRPFLILGDNNVYPKLKSLGFDTFDDLFGTWWNDNNWEKRAKSIVDILENFRLEECIKHYKNILPRLIKNRERFLIYINENKQRIENLL